MSNLFQNIKFDDLKQFFTSMIKIDKKMSKTSDLNDTLSQKALTSLNYNPSTDTTQVQDLPKLETMLRPECNTVNDKDSTLSETDNQNNLSVYENEEDKLTMKNCSINGSEVEIQSVNSHIVEETDNMKHLVLGKPNYINKNIYKFKIKNQSLLTIKENSKQSTDKSSAAQETVKLLAMGAVQAMSQNMSRNNKKQASLALIEEKRPFNNRHQDTSTYNNENGVHLTEPFSLEQSTVATLSGLNAKMSEDVDNLKPTTASIFNSWEDNYTNSFSKRLSVADAVQFLVKQSEDTVLDIPKLKDVFELFVKEKNFYMTEKAFNLLYNARSVPIIVYKKIIRICCRHLKFQQAEKHLNQLIDHLAVFDQSETDEDKDEAINILNLCFIIYLDTLMSQNQTDNFLNYLHQILYDYSSYISLSSLNKICYDFFKFHPDKHAASALIDLLIESCNLSRLQNQKVFINEALFATLINATMRYNDMDDFMKLYNLYMKKLSNNFVPDLQTCGYILKFFGNYSHIKICCEFFNFINEKYDMKLNEIIYGCMLDAYVRKHMMTEAVELFEKMKSEGYVTPNTIIYSTIIKGYAQTKQLDEALELYETMKSENLPLNTVTYNTLIDACARVHAMDQAAKLLDEMLKSNVEPDIITFSTIVKGYCIQNDIIKAVQILDVMTDRGIQSDGILYNILLDGCVRASRIDLCEQLWQRMQDQDVLASNITLTILIKMFGKEGNLARAFEIVGEISKKHKIHINTHVYTCLMSACIANKNYTKALEVFRCMKMDGVEADIKAYETIIFGLIRWNNYSEAIKIVREIFQLDQAQKSDIPFKLYSKSLKSLWNAVSQAGKLYMIADTIKDMKDAYGHKIRPCLPKKFNYPRKPLKQNNNNLEGGGSPLTTYSSYSLHEWIPSQIRWKQSSARIH